MCLYCFQLVFLLSALFDQFQSCAQKIHNIKCACDSATYISLRQQEVCYNIQQDCIKMKHLFTSHRFKIPNMLPRQIKLFLMSKERWSVDVKHILSWSRTRSRVEAKVRDLCVRSGSGSLSATGTGRFHGLFVCYVIQVRLNMKFIMRRFKGYTEGNLSCGAFYL